MKLKININYKQTKQPEGVKVFTNSGLTINYIEYAVGKKYEKGLEGQKRRMWGRVQRKLDEVVDSGKDSIDVERAELDFIAEAFKDTAFPPNTAKYVVMFENELERLANEKEK